MRILSLPKTVVSYSFGLARFRRSVGAERVVESQSPGHQVGSLEVVPPSVKVFGQCACQNIQDRRSGLWNLQMHDWERCDSVP